MIYLLLFTRLLFPGQFTLSTWSVHYHRWCWDNLKIILLMYFLFSSDNNYFAYLDSPMWCVYFCVLVWFGPHPPVSLLLALCSAVTPGGEHRPTKWCWESHPGRLHMIQADTVPSLQLMDIDNNVLFHGLSALIHCQNSECSFPLSQHLWTSMIQ